MQAPLTTPVFHVEFYRFRPKRNPSAPTKLFMRILLAEDERKVAEHLRAGLIAEGYAVDLASDGDEAIWLAEENKYDALSFR